MQWRMLARRGRNASWTVVGDAAQASWGDLDEARAAQVEAYGSHAVRGFHMDTNYRNAREIFDYARDVILPLVPDADIPEAVRETGVDPVDRIVERAPRSRPWRRPSRSCSARSRARSRSSRRVAGPTGSPTSTAPATDGSRSSTRCRPRASSGTRRSCVDPDAIIDESPGGVRVLYVVLTRAAHRMTVLRPA